MTPGRPYWINAYTDITGDKIFFGMPWTSRRVAEKMVGDEPLASRFADGNLMPSPPRSYLVYRIVLQLRGPHL